MSDQTSGDLEAREIAREQAVVDRVYDQLDKAARTATLLAREGHDRARLGHEGGLVERDAMVYQSAKRIAALDAAHEGLVFGRIDLADRAEDPRYVGRIGLRDDDHESILIDWRAPAASVFYQATPAEPRGVARRRVLRCRGQRVVGVEDDLLDADAAGDLPVIGRGCAAGAALARPRPADALDRGHDPGGAGPGDPGAHDRRGRDQRRPRHGQDRGGAAPGRLPALQRAASLRARRGARGGTRRASSCATSSGCCPRWARPR